MFSGKWILLPLMLLAALGPLPPSAPAGEPPAAGGDIPADPVNLAVTRGWELWDQGRPVDAAMSFRRATLLAPDYAPGYFGQAFVFSHLREWKLAEYNYRRTIELAPEYPMAYSNLAVVYGEMGRLDEAWPLVDQSLALAPKDPVVLTNAAALRFHGGDYFAAWSLLTRARKVKAAVDPRLAEALAAKMSEAEYRELAKKQKAEQRRRKKAAPAEGGAQ